MNFDPIKSAAEMVKKIHISSVFGSILFIMPYLLGAFVLISFTKNSSAQVFLMWIIGILFSVFILTYIGILLFGDHKELQSEDHVYRMKALEVLGDHNHVLQEAQKIENKNNPDLEDPHEIKTPETPDKYLKEKNG